LSEESELFQWVESLTNEGTWQSEGRFTLDKDKAWSKLGTHQLPFAEAWALKLVQAAVLSVASELRVNQTGSETTFQFVGQKRWKEESVTQALFSSGSVIDQGLIPLAAAVRHIARSAERLFALHYPDGTTQIWNGEAFHSEPSPHPTQHFELTVFSAKKHGLKWSLIPSADELAGLRLVLSSIAYPSPIPITLNGRTINGFSKDPHAGASTATAPIALLPLKPDTHLPEFRFLRDKEWDPSSQEVQVQLKGEVEPLRGDPLSCGALACLTASTRELSNPPRFAPQACHLKFIRDGVLVHAERIAPKGSIGVTILVSAEGLRTDLGGLALDQDYNYHLRKKQARNRVRAELRKLADIGQTLKVSLKGGSHKAAMLGLTGLGFVNPLFLGLAGIAAAQFASDKLRVRRREFQLADDFRHLCREF
jgi:hypothetical protein